MLLDFDALIEEIDVGIVEAPENDIAVIGLSGRFPKAENASEFWANIRSGRDCIGELPEGRTKDLRQYLRLANSGEESAEFDIGGYLGQICDFDYDFFGLSPREASLMNPNQRILMQVIWSCLEDSGYVGSRLSKTKTGIYVGHSSDSITYEHFDYSRLIALNDPDALTAALTGNISSILASRIAYFLDLKGPALVVDTACSSSLVAVHMACLGIRNGDCEQAIVGGVKICGMPVKRKQRLGIESADGRAKTFDSSADGTGRGEGAGAILIKPLNKAVIDCDNIYAVIKGSAVNQDGHSIGITAPNAEAQERVILDAWQGAGIDPRTISYIEAHGTGTSLGDPIEIDGITGAFRNFTDRRQFCAISSLKTNIGHLDNASGIAGLIKTILAMKNEELPPSINFKHPNQKIDFEDSPVYVNDKLREWKTCGIKRCGVSAFGLSGTNCHVVLEEPPKPAREISPKPDCHVFTLSAKDRGSLAASVKEYVKFLGDNRHLRIGDVCFTASAGREHFSCRLCLVVSSVDELVLRLGMLANLDSIDEKPAEGVYLNLNATKQGNGISGKTADLIDLYQKTNSADCLDAISQLYAQGHDIEWEQLFPVNSVQRISLPTYSFRGARCWATDSGLDDDEVVLTGKQSGCYTDTEIEVAKIWREALGYSTFDVTKHFYEMGGDSITAIRAAAMVESRLGCEIDLAEFLRLPTISGISKVVASKKEGSKKSRVRQAEPRESYPVSSAQKRLYLLDKIDRTTAYNLPFALELKGKADLGVLRQALLKLMDLHDSLRTEFHFADGNIVQKINRGCMPDIIQLYASLDDMASVVDGFVKPFDLSKAPLFRACLVSTAADSHVLLIDCHHIITDGESMNLLVSDLSKLYSGALPERGGIQYTDYSVWQEEMIKTDYYNRQKAYWKSTISGDAPVLNMSTDFVRPPLQKFDGDRIEFEIEDRLYKKITGFSSQNAKTATVVLLAAYGLLLWKYTGQQEIVIGVPVLGRPFPELRKIVGMFVNTVPFLFRMDAAMSFSEVVNRVDSNMKLLLENQDYPFELLLNDVNPVRDLSRNPLFDTMFTMGATDNKPVLFAGMESKAWGIRNRASKFDISMEMQRTGSSMFFNVEYSTNLFAEDSVKLFGRRYMHLLETLLDEPLAKLDGICLSMPGELDDILYSFNDTEAYYDKSLTLSRVFERQASLTPDFTALSISNQRTSYCQLNEMANAIAHALIEAGVGPNTIVVIIVERSVLMIAGILGILKAGGAYLPVDHKNPQGRIDYIIGDSGAEVVLSQNKFKDRFTHAPKTVSLEDAASLDGNKTNLPAIASPTDLAYVIYTSGSTGNPKGVMIEHHSVVNRISWMQKKYGISHGDAILQKTPYTFDVSVWELFWWAFTGAQLCILAPEAEKNPEEVIEAICENSVTTLHFVPSMLNVFLDYVEATKSAHKLESLTQVFSSGEALSVDTARKFYEMLYVPMGIKLHNLYGPTEATVDVSYFDCFENGCPDQIPIGKPIDNTQLFIVDKENHLLPAGVPGELFISGVCLGRGYLNREELTREKYVDGVCEVGKRMYKTGDLAKWLPDGNIAYLGRNDFQVKIRGNRIELGEVQSRVSEYGGIKEAVVISREVKGNDCLFCFYVADKTIEPRDLKNHLLLSLPDYMVPAYFVKLDEMPLSGNGKIDRKRLPVPAQASRPAGFVKPESESEVLLMNIWREVLGRNDIGVSDNFFDVGGNSIILVQAFNKLVQVLGPDTVKITDLFSYPTISELAEYIDGNTKNPNAQQQGEPGEASEVRGCLGDIAIIGMSARLPSSNNVEEFWENIVLMRDLIRELPDARKADADAYWRSVFPDGADGGQDGQEYMQGGYLDRIDEFDCKFFKISPEEAALMDPNQRLFLQSAWETIEEAGYTEEKISGISTGVYLGFAFNELFDYKRYIFSIDPSLAALSLAGNISSIIASRISYHLNIKGPSMIVDTACSSALSAVHLACQAINTGDCDMALAGGVRFSLLPIKMRDKLGIESSDGRARAFDNNADGTGFGEGVVSILLKPLQKALKDNDHIHAVVKGTAINQDGKSVGITAPNSIAQANVIKKAWECAQINPETVEYIETHGTGTILGDPIEIEGISRAFEGFTDKKQFCAIASTKSNIGHLDNISGMAGLIKAVMALKHKTLPPTLHFQWPNMNIMFEDSPVYVNDQVREWTRKDHPRRCGVSAFGLSGTNCHVILEEAPEPEPAAFGSAGNQRRVFTLSAKDSVSLKCMMSAYLEFLQGHEVDFDAVCYTVNVGRNHFSHRFGTAAGNARELVLKLSEALYRDTDGPPPSSSGKRQLDLETPDSLADLYEEGADIEWGLLYEKPFTKLSLPPYHFLRNRCWVKPKEMLPEGKDAIALLPPVKLNGRLTGVYSETEEKVAMIWGGVFGYSELNVTDNFFELGGDSIYAMRIIKQIEELFGTAPAFSDILSNPTIEGLSVWLSGSPADFGEGNFFDSIRKAPELEHYPLSPVQCEIISHVSKELPHTAYNIPCIITTNNEVSLTKVRGALVVLMNRHELLRSSMHQIDGRFVQKINGTRETADAFQVHSKVISKKNLVNEIKEFDKPFDLTKPPLIRAVVFQTKSSESYIVIDTHYIIADALSLNTLMKDFVDIYMGRALANLEVCYKDYCYWHDAYLATPELKRQKLYWMSKFKRAVPEVNLPTDYEWPGFQTFRLDTIYYPLGKDLTKKLKALAADCNATLYMVLVAVFNVFLALYCKQEDIVIGASILERPHSVFDNVFGNFTKILPVVGHVGGNKKFSEFLEEMRLEILDLFNNSDYPLKKIVDFAKPGADESKRDALINVTFILHNVHGDFDKTDGFDATIFEREYGRYDLNFFVAEIEGRLIYMIRYRKDLFKKKTVKNMAGNLVQITQSVVDNPDTLISHISLKKKLFGFDSLANAEDYKVVTG
ncbi:MAG: amino acid adenylation domain-containing protein [Clostridiales bacterium]|nr:amino acid adenylation domain-containing protein [Clostridiales bacterium]